MTDLLILKLIYITNGTKQIRSLKTLPFRISRLYIRDVSYGPSSPGSFFCFPAFGNCSPVFLLMLSSTAWMRSKILASADLKWRTRCGNGISIPAFLTIWFILTVTSLCMVSRVSASAIQNRRRKSRELSPNPRKIAQGLGLSRTRSLDSAASRSRSSTFCGSVP